MGGWMYTCMALPDRKNDEREKNDRRQIQQRIIHIDIIMLLRRFHNHNHNHNHNPTTEKIMRVGMKGIGIHRERRTNKYKKRETEIEKVLY